MVYSPQQRAFGCNKHTGLPAQCRACKYLLACHGECPKNRFLKTSDGEPGLNYLCPGIRRFLDYAGPYLTRITAELQAKGA